MSHNNHQRFLAMLEDQHGILYSDSTDKYQRKKEQDSMKIMVTYKKAEPQLIRVMQGEKIEPGSDDFYYFYFEDDDIANFRMNHPFSEGWLADDRPQAKYFCPASGAHFEVGDMVKRINEVGNMRTKLDSILRRRAILEQQQQQSRNASRG